MLKKIKSYIRFFLEKSLIGRRYLQHRKDCQRRQVLANVQKFGPMAMMAAHSVFTKLKIPYFVSDGTLLGLIREGGILAHDDDVDFSILPCEIDLKELIAGFEGVGFSFFWAWEYNGRITEIGFTYKGVHVDVYLLTEKNNRFVEHWYTPIPGMDNPTEEYWPGYECLKMKVDVIEKMYIERYGLEVMVPNNYEEYLSFTYDNWRVPDPDSRRRALVQLGQGDGKRIRLAGCGHRLTYKQFFDLLANKSAI